MNADPSRHLVGALVADRYQIQRKIAVGGMGIVYLAEQIPLGRRVALKILDTGLLDAQRALNFGERFFLEAAAVAELQHPNTITIYDYGKTSDGVLFYAMEYVGGASMQGHVHAHGPLSVVETVHVGLQICGSLREAHGNGLIHRDLKPGNIMLTERLDDPMFVKVLDFGLVKVVREDKLDAADLTQSGALLGSPRYMAPEQILRSSLDLRCDIYSLGGVLYYALTGFPPFTQQSQYEVLRAQVEQAPPPMATLCPSCEVTERLDSLVTRCLDKDRDRRPQSMTEVAEELALCARELGIDASLAGALSGSVTGRPAAVASRAPEALGRGALLEPVAELSESSAAEHAPSTRSQSPMDVVGAVHVEVAPTVPGAVPGRAPSGGTRSVAGLAVLGLSILALVVVGAGVFAFAFFSGEAARGSVPALASAPPEPAPLEPAPPEPAVASVRIVSDPPSAQVRRDGVDLGDAPFTLEIPHGEQWELTVSLDGHQTRTVLASPGRDVLHVRLRPVPRRGTRRVRGAASEARATARAPQAPRAAASEADRATPSPEPPPPVRRSHSDLRNPWAQ